jgi:hypothetical protein
VFYFDIKKRQKKVLPKTQTDGSLFWEARKRLIGSPDLLSHTSPYSLCGSVECFAAPLVIVGFLKTREQSFPIFIYHTIPMVANLLLCGVPR